MIILKKGSKDYTGQKFGTLTFVQPLEQTKDGVIWELLCDCGSIRKTVPKNVINRPWPPHCSVKCLLIKKKRPANQIMSQNYFNGKGKANDC
jgi:hypothetical protein